MKPNPPYKPIFLLILTCIYALFLVSKTAASTLADPPCPDAATPPGPYASPNPADFTAVETFTSQDKLVATYYFYWYDAAETDDLVNGINTHLAERIHHELDESPTVFTWRNPEWHARHLRDMMAASIDIILPVYWGVPCNNDPLYQDGLSYLDLFSRDGLRNLVQAYQELRSAGAQPPKIGMFYDTHSLGVGTTYFASYMRKTSNDDPRADLTSAVGMERFYLPIRDFYSLLPPETWAMIDGKPIVWLYNTGWVFDYNGETFRYIQTRFAEDFGGMEPYIVRENSWQADKVKIGTEYMTDNAYTWGVSLYGYNRIQTIAAIGPGYNESALKERYCEGKYAGDPDCVPCAGENTTGVGCPRIRGRAGGDWYAGEWQKVLNEREQVNIVAIEVWNEYHEGNSIAETREFGRMYIDLTAKYAALFRGQRLAAPPISVNGFGIGSPHFRMNIADIAPKLDEQQAMGIQFSRGDIPWESIEPTLGNWQWRDASGFFDFDLLLTQYRQRDIQMLAILNYGPRYLNGNPANNNLVDSQQLLAYWRGYVRKVVQELGDRIDYWEVGNEMNSRGFWGKVVHEPDAPAEPDPALYAQMLIIASEEIKAHDPDDVVILGGLVTITDKDCATNPFDYLYRLNAVNPSVWDAVDAVALHPYWGPHPPEAVIDRGKAHNPNTGACLPDENVQRSLIQEVRAFRDLVVRYGEKPVWITEIGWSEAWLNNDYRPNSTPEQVEADYLVRTYVPLLSEPGVEAVIWYTQVDDSNDPSGEFALDGPGQRAMANLTALLQGSQPLGQFQGQNDEWNVGDDVFEYRFDKDGQLIIVIWKAQGALEERRVTLENIDVSTLSRYTLDAADLSSDAGEELTVAEDGTLNIYLTERPVFLVGEQLNWWDAFWRSIQGTIENWWQEQQDHWANWWQEQQDNLENWSQEQQDKFAEWWGEQRIKLELWWDEQIVKLELWWSEQWRKLEIQLVQLLEQMCYGTAVLPVAVTLIWWKQRRKHCL